VSSERRARAGTLGPVIEEVVRAFDERLLDVRTPGDYALSPDGRTLVWAAHATVDDVGRHFPSDLWIGGLDDDPRRLTAGRLPAWSPDGTSIAGELDRCTPPSQGEELFRALSAAGCETELVVLPGEGHVPVSRRYALEAIRLTQAWFDRFLRTP
jgi:pimeloyl-ACP methyl ester carboxylesterase